MSPIYLLHWEAQYPVEKVQQALLSWKLPEEISTNNIFIAMPQGYLELSISKLAPANFALGANDMLDALPGSFTGSIAGSFLKNSQARFVLIGSDFKRHKMCESPASMNQKVRTALASGITPFFCFCGIDKEGEEKNSIEVIQNELKVLEGLSSEELQSTRFIYDPSFDKSCTSYIKPETLKEAYEACQKTYREVFGEDTAKNLKTLCGIPPFFPVNKSFTEISPFAGFYFKMNDLRLPQIGH